MTAETVQTARREVDRLETELAAARQTLAQSLARSQDAGASIAQLIEWTGYSRRQVFNLLGAAKPS